MSVPVSGMLKPMPFGELLGVGYGFFRQCLVPGQWRHAHFGPRRVVHVKGALQVVVDVGRLSCAIRLKDQQARGKKMGKCEVH